MSSNYRKIRIIEVRIRESLLYMLCKYCFLFFYDYYIVLQVIRSTDKLRMNIPI